jgi:hypothetical protein
VLPTVADADHHRPELTDEGIALVRRAGIEEQVGHRRRRAIDVLLHRRQREALEIRAAGDVRGRRTERRHPIKRPLVVLGECERGRVDCAADELDHVGRLVAVTHAPLLHGDGGSSGDVFRLLPFFRCISYLPFLPFLLHLSRRSPRAPV